VPLQATFNKRSFATEAFRYMFFGDDEAPALYRKAADGATVNNGTTLKVEAPSSM
jgi:hypothetical protein